jgi:hypothetical protein
MRFLLVIMHEVIKRGSRTNAGFVIPDAHGGTTQIIFLQVNTADESRQFVLSYFMNDDTVSVFEPPIRNSGMIGGTFLERGIKYKPGTEEQYTYKDLYVGAEIVINQFNFMLVNADEYTFSYMENNKHLFIMGDGNAVLQLLQAQVAVRGVSVTHGATFGCAKNTCYMH